MYGTTHLDQTGPFDICLHQSPVTPGLQEAYRHNVNRDHTLSMSTYLRSVSIGLLGSEWQLYVHRLL
jgi:hypothetical protein